MTQYQVDDPAEPRVSIIPRPVAGCLAFVPWVSRPAILLSGLSGGMIDVAPAVPRAACLPWNSLRIMIGKQRAMECADGG